MVQKRQIIFIPVYLLAFFDPFLVESISICGHYDDYKNKWNICGLISKCWQGDYCVQVSKAFSWEGKESIHEQIINWIHCCHSNQSALPFFIQPLPSSASNFSLWFLWWQHCLHQQRWCSVYASHREQELRREFKINLQKKSHEKLPDIYQTVTLKYTTCNSLSELWSFYPAGFLINASFKEFRYDINL